MAKDWIVNPPWDKCHEAAHKWGVPKTIAQILHNRNITSLEAAKTFLSPSLMDLHPPEELPGAVLAAKLLGESVRSGRRIILYGDYDVDGITGVTILWKMLREAKADVGYYVPHRLDEGYGLNADAIRKLAEQGTQTIVSIDCGITAIDVAKLAGELGIELIITDHHTPKEELPDQAAVIVHPSVGGQYPNPNLCGAGVAFKLAWMFAQEMSGCPKVSAQFRDLLLDLLPLAALGTIADVVSLTGENRIIARHGLARLGNTDDVGLKALIASSDLSGRRIGDYEVGFRLAPRLNAAGRMGHARLAVEMLTRAGEERAREIALYLEDHNRARQAKERRIVKQACEMIDEADLASDARRGIVLASEGWHPGVIGIVASRIVDRYRRPTVLIAINNGTGQGSARSIAQFQLHDALGECSDHLITFGGHAMAAGLKIASSEIDSFRDAFIEQTNQMLTGADMRSKLRIDARVGIDEIDVPTIYALEQLGPFGQDNPKPRFCTDWLELADEPRCVGKSGDHLTVSLRQDGVVLRGIAFGQADVAPDLKEHRRCQVAFEPIVNEFKGRRSAEMRILDFRFPD